MRLDRGERRVCECERGEVGRGKERKTAKISASSGTVEGVHWHRALCYVARGEGEGKGEASEGKKKERKRGYCLHLCW